MPLYTPTTEAGVLGGDAKAKLAGELTVLHSEYPGVPKGAHRPSRLCTGRRVHGFARRRHLVASGMCDEQPRNRRLLRGTNLIDQPRLYARYHGENRPRCDHRDTNRKPDAERQPFAPPSLRTQLGITTHAAFRLPVHLAA